MKLSFWDYIRSAFNARPIGMFVPPNWIGLGAFAFLGVLNPGFWLLGVGLELAYLYILSTNLRFQNVVNGSQLLEARRQWQSRLHSLTASLTPPDQDRFRNLESRCQSILSQQQSSDPSVQLETQSEGLGRLLWMYLRLLLMRQSIYKILRDAASPLRQGGELLDDRKRRLEQLLKDPSITEELRRSYSGQIEILQQRLQGQREARDKLAFLDAELMRIEQQVELIREQAVISTDPAAVSQRIDAIATTLGNTNQWIREQQQVYGNVEDLLAEPPAIPIPTAKETQ
ncbi:MAG: hypothetical protein NTU53_09165 [Planctomycetota bacterium]|nr:hypothetical protein [Planctomycetota bacterium]